MTTPEIDEAALAAWLSTQGKELVRLDRLSGDVSPRRYGRVGLADGRTAIVARYTRAMRDTCRRFEATTALLEEAAIPVPEILASDCEQGFMLLEDAGPHTLYDLRSRPLAERLPLVKEAVTIAGSFASIPPERLADLNPALDAALLQRELEQTIEAYLGPRGLLGGGTTRRAFEECLLRLCETLGSERPVPCHRDFMSRNLVPRPTGELVVLDHQDLRLGPPAYDLASLLNDSFHPPPEVEAQLLAPAIRSEADRRSYHRAAAQRTLKAVGTFALFAEHGFDRHLTLIPPTLARALAHLESIPECAALAPELRELWEPVVGDAARR